jgi:hypothetical protein
VRNEEVLHIVKEERDILRTVRGRKDQLVGHILLRNCFLNTLLKERWMEAQDEEEGVRSCWFTLKKRESK